MIVYVEYVLIDNFVIDYLLLKISLNLSNVSYKKLRLILSCVFGSIFALAFPLLNFVTIIEIPIKIIFGLLMVVFSGNFQSKRQAYKCMVTFIFVVMLSGGIVMGAYNFLHLDYSSELSIGLMFLPIIVITSFIKSFVLMAKKRKTLTEFSFDVVFQVSNVRVKANGFLDTGNGAYDGFSPIVFCSKEVVNEFMNKGIFLKFKKININTVNGGLDKLSFKTQTFEIFFNGKTHIFNNVTVCVTDNIAGEQVLLHPALMGELYDKKTYVKTEKAS